MYKWVLKKLKETLQVTSSNDTDEILVDQRKNGNNQFGQKETKMGDQIVYLVFHSNISFISEWEQMLCSHMDSTSKLSFFSVISHHFVNLIQLSASSSLLALWVLNFSHVQLIDKVFVIQKEILQYSAFL